MRQRLFSLPLTTDGTPTGTFDAVGNYSVTPQTFYIEDTTRTLSVARLLVTVQDSGGFRASGYGAVASSLTNGIELRVVDDDGVELVNLTAAANIMSNADWGSYCYDVDYKSWGVGDNFLLVRWTFTRSGAPIILEPGHKLEVILNDDFSGLVHHYFVVQGVK